MAQTDLILKLQAQTAQFNRQLNQTERKFNSFNKRMNKTANMIQGALMTAFGGLAVINGIQNATKKIADFEFQMAKVRAVSGASASEVAKLEKNARELGAVSQFTASEIGKLQEELARLGFGVDQIINMTDASRKLAQVADAELGEAARVVGQMLNAFNLTAEDSGRVANVMSESFSKSALDIEKFSTAMASVSAVASNAGYSIEQTTAMIGKLVDNGIDASTAGTQLRQVFLKLVKEGMTLEQALDHVGTGIDSNRKALDIFDVRAVPVITTLAKMRTEVAELTDELADNNVELDKQAAIMEDTLLGDWKEFNSALEESTLKAKVFLPFLRGILQAATNIFTNDPGDGLHGRMKELYNDAIVAEDPLKEINRLFKEGALNAAQLLTLTDRISQKLSQSGPITGPNEAPDFTLDIPIPEPKQNPTTASGPNFASGAGIDTNPFTATAESIGFTSDILFNESETLARAGEQYIKSFDKITTDFDGVIADFNQVSVGGLANAFAGIGTAFASGENVTKAAFAGLLGGIGTGLQQMGGALIAYGVSLDAFKKAIANPAVAFIAGAAAITAGAAVARYAQKIGGSGGGGSVPSTTGAGGSFGGSSSPGTFRSGQSSQFGVEGQTRTEENNPTDLDQWKEFDSFLSEQLGATFDSLNIRLDTWRGLMDTVGMNTFGIWANMSQAIIDMGLNFDSTFDGMTDRLDEWRRAVESKGGLDLSGLGFMEGLSNFASNPAAVANTAAAAAANFASAQNGGGIVARIDGNDIVLVSERAAATNSRFQANRRGQLSITR